MEPKSTVVKSKSSNSGISKKSKEDRKPQTHKKTRSSADFPNGPKKRGVYVEKRLTKLNLVNNEKNIDAVTQKPPARPRAGQKKFLASVLTILSKSTTGTQFPETNDDTKEVTFKKKPTLKRNKDEDIGNNVNTRNTKERYKSRVLNKKFVKEDRKKMVVLQSRKEIAQTPSNYSEWSYNNASQKSNTSNYLTYDDLNNNNIGEDLNIADELKNALLEGRNMKKVKKLRYVEEDPKTLVSDGPKVQKNLYNFFVDLLETTISVYNVKTEYDNAPSDTSKTVLQINESVANKLNIANDKVPNDEVIVNPTFIDIQNESDYEDYDSFNKPITIKTSELRLKSGKHKKLKAVSFIRSNKKSVLPKSKSLEINKKTMFKNKNELINVLKQQLEVETHVFEEPRSIFQALRVMARNKKRIRFDPSIERKTFTDECILRRRKVISSRKTKKIKSINNDAINNNMFRPKTSFNKPDKTDSRKKVKRVTDTKRMYGTDYKDSYHSIEVYGYDYESKQPEMFINKPKDVTFTYHSSPTNSELDFDINDAILNPTSEFSIKKLSAEI
ncbi:uncharacterized protein [Epargyreus clarus]|uniref:uncharacterized protein n=1 Tax=Epargyreus clarus TaxID=520877 RepID=UPI003C2AE0FB